MVGDYSANNSKPTAEGLNRQRIRITCLCGDPNHAVILHKQRGAGCTSCYPFDTGYLSARSSMGQTAGPVDVPAHCFVQDSHDAVQFGLLPDLGTYVRVILQRRYFTPGSVKHSRKCARILEVSCFPQSTSKRKHWVNDLLTIVLLHFLKQDHTGSSKSSWTKGASCMGGDPGPLPVAFVEGFIDGLCCTLLQDSIPCMRRAKRSIKFTVFQSPPTNVEVAACINILHGTLLSLYPKAVRRPTFLARVPIAMRIRQLICASKQQQMDFLASYPYLVKLCFMEYVMNLLEECMPIEMELLLGMPSMKLYQSVCQTTCDSFRSEVIATGLEDWEHLDNAACLFIDRCIRMCKFKMYRTMEPVCRVYETTLTFRKQALDMPSSYGCIPLMQLLGTHDGNEDVLLSASRLQTMLVAYNLPLAITKMQIQILGDMYGSCCKMSFAACHSYICCVCAISGKGINTSLRFCSETGSISCVCGAEGSILVVNMIGVLLKVCNTSYYMCPCCTNIRVWKGDGNDLHPVGCIAGKGVGCECAKAEKYGVGNLFEQITQIGWNGSPGNIGVNKQVDVCSVCMSKHMGSQKPIYVPDIETRSLKRIVLCSKHRISEHVLKTIWSYQDFLQTLRNQVSN